MKTSLVKINKDLYKEAAEIAKADKITYPSIKNFIEIAVRNQINLIKYNIENREQIVSEDGRLIRKNKDFIECFMCGDMFLPGKEGNKLCFKCNKIISRLIGKVKK